jgi:SAM-dependent methyltransferase
MTTILLPHITKYVNDYGKCLPLQERMYFRQNIERYIDVLRLIKGYGLNGNTAMLDIGTGFGHLTDMTQGLFNFNISAVDIKNRRDKPFVKECDISHDRLPYPDNHFDLILCCEVIEHLTTLPYTMIYEVYRVLKPNGRLILTTRNLYSLTRRIGFMLGKRIIPPISIRGDDVSTINNFKMRVSQRKPKTSSHYREYDKAELESLMCEAGLKVKVVKYMRTQLKVQPKLWHLVCVFVELLIPSLRDGICLESVK